MNLFQGSNVSIPFKRETSSKLDCDFCSPRWYRVSIPFKRETSSKLAPIRLKLPPPHRFNSFKRETSSKLWRSQYLQRCSLCFNSLQTGNFFQTRFFPYKSEEQFDVFQFPSNGKLLPNSPPRFHAPSPPPSVSIPFKRETSSKLPYRDRLPRVQPLRFNSLQTGNFFQTRLLASTLPRLHLQFQFPSNGKLLPNFRIGTGFQGSNRYVSIPFKRETSSKQQAIEGVGIKPVLVSIPFKRETSSKREVWGSGCKLVWVSIPFKRETSSKPDIWAQYLARLHLEFQFPSNGKLLPNPFMLRTAFVTVTTGFNSLQTGNCFQTGLAGEQTGSLTPCFNSLQTGKFFQTNNY